MKSLSMATCVALLLCSACTKVKPDGPITESPKAVQISGSTSAENLGSPLKGTNVSWLINPLYPNLKPLITFAPNSNSGYVALMIDNGLLNGATPVNPFRFIAVDLQSHTSKTITVTMPNGAPLQNTLGRVTRYVFGMNKKLYVSTEAGFGGGGHIVEYDPHTQTAIDLGRPFFAKGKYLDVYMLNTGKDGALYGGSFGDDGDVYTFRYNYNSQFEVDNTPINGDSKYVAYVTGDEKYTYASVGQDTWQLFAIERQTGIKTLLMRYNTPDERIELASHADACYAKRGATHYKLTGTITQAMNNRPLTDRVVYSPYDNQTANLPELVWNGSDKRMYYRFNGGAEGSVKVNDVVEDIYPTATMLSVNNNLFISAAKVPELVSYNRSNGFKYLGNYAITAHSMTLSDNSANPAIFMGGYPKGAVLEYEFNQNWTVNSLTPSYTPPDISAAQSNPQKVVQFQDADANGVRGSMYLSAMFYTKTGYLVAGGNNDRLTTSTNRELSIGSFKNGVKRNVYLPEFSNYQFSGMCLSKDSNLAYVAARSSAGAMGKIYIYNPVTNTITGSMDFPMGAGPGTIRLFSDNIIVGTSGATVYLYDISKKELIFKHDMGFSQRIYSLTIAPDNSVYINMTGTDIFTTRVVKLNIKNTPGNITADVALMSILYDADRDENTKPNEMVFVKNTAGSYDLYISGLKSLYRVNGCCIA